MAFTRRYFFYGSLLAGAVPAMGFGSTPSLKSAGYKSPNEKLNFAAIGSGGQGASNISAAAPTENIVALCDVDDRRAATTFTRFEKATKYKDFRQMLDKEGKNIDAVIVATPDHMHATAAMWCMERSRRSGRCPRRSAACFLMTLACSGCRSQASASARAQALRTRAAFAVRCSTSCTRKSRAMSSSAAPPSAA